MGDNGRHGRQFIFLMLVAGQELLVTSDASVPHVFSTSTGSALPSAHSFPCSKENVGLSPCIGVPAWPRPEEMVSKVCGTLPRSLALLVDDIYQATATEPSVETGHFPSYCSEAANMFASRGHTGRDSLAPQGWPTCLTLLCGTSSAHLLPWPGEGTSNAWH